VRRTILALAATLLAGVPLVAGSVSTAACGTSAAGGGDGGQNPAGPPILLGGSVDLTGSLKGNAPAMKGGLLAAAQQVNALGGILGREVKVVVQDDQGSPSQALTVAMSLAGMGASALIGPVGSQEVASDLPFIQSTPLVEVSSTATSVELSGACPPKTAQTTCPTGSAYQSGNSFFFRTVPSDALQALAVGIFALRGPAKNAATACKKMDVVHNDDAYGNPLDAGIEKYFVAQGGKVPKAGGFAVGSNSTGPFSMDQINPILTDLPDCVVLAVYPPTAAAFMQDLSLALASGAPTGWNANFFVIGTDGVYDPSFITDGLADPAKPMGISYVNGTMGPPVYGTVAATNNPTRAQYNELVSLYVAEVGFDNGATDLDPYASNQYDAAILTLLAMQAAGTTTDEHAIQKSMFDVSRGKSSNAAQFGPMEIGDALSALRTGSDINYQGASGDVDFDDYGNVIADFLVWEVQGTGFVNHDTISSLVLQAAAP